MKVHRRNDWCGASKAFCNRVIVENRPPGSERAVELMDALTRRRLAPNIAALPSPLRLPGGKGYASAPGTALPNIAGAERR